jgi:predicted MFS family arabinose efflux permease
MLGVTAAWAGADWRLVAIYTAAALAGSTEILADSAAETAVPGLVGRAGLEKAHSRLIGTQVVLNDAVGAPVGSWLATIGFGWTLGIPAVLYGVAGLVVRTLRLPAAPSAGPGGVTTSSVQNDIRAGTSFVWNHGLLRRMAFGNMAMNLGNTAFFAVAVLILIGPMGLPRSAFGFFLSLLALGGVVGSLVAERVVARLGQAVTVKSGPVVLGAGYGVICLTVNPIVTAVAAIGIGASGMLWNVANRVVRQRATPDAVLGRVTATMKVLALAMTPVGAVVGGAVGQWLGVRAVGYVAVGSAAMAFLALWGIPDHPSPMPNQVFDTPHRTR